MTHALDVRSHVSVPELGGAREAVDRLLLRLAELLLGSSQSLHARLELGGALADGGLERHRAQAALELEATATERVRDVDQKLVVVEGLDDVAVRAELERLLGDLRVVGAGDHDRRRLGMRGGDVLDELEAGLARHVQVAESEVEGRAREHFARLGSVPGRLAVVAVCARACESASTARSRRRRRSGFGLASTSVMRPPPVGRARARALREHGARGPRRRRASG